MSNRCSNEIEIMKRKINSKRRVSLSKKFVIIFTILLIENMCLGLGFLSENFGANVYGATSKSSSKSSSSSSTNSTKDEKNVDLTLKSLNIDDLKLYPEFDSNITTYYVSCPSNKKSLDVNYEVNVEGTKVAVTGNKNLAKTESIIKVSLSKNGSIPKTYNIYVTKQSTDGPKLSSLEINGVELSPSFSEDNYYYNANVKYINEISPLEITATPENEGTKVEILGNTSSELKDGDNNIISIVLTGSKNVTIYQINVTFQKSNVIDIANNSNGNDSLSNFNEKLSDFWKKFIDFYNANQIPFLAGVAAIIIAILIIIINKSNNKKAKQNRKKMKDRV